MIRYRYTYNRRVAKASGPMETYFADKLLARLIQWLKTRLIPHSRKGYKVEVNNKPGERGFWLTLPGDQGFIAVETGFEVTDEGIVQVNTENGLERKVKLVGNAAADLVDLKVAVEDLHDRFEQSL